MGTPEFAVPALKMLHKSGHEIVLVVTQPDRPKGRGRKVLPSPVKKVALDLRYDVSQPLSIKTAEFAKRINKLKPDMYARAIIGISTEENILSIPEGAILRSGKRDIVFVSLGGGRFEPRLVQLGPRMDGYYQERSEGHYFFSAPRGSWYMVSVHRPGHGEGLDLCR